jgi:hypothetical protein
MSASNNANVSIDAHADSYDLSRDLVWGADEIAAELNISRRQAFHQLKKGHLPARKQGGHWVASRLGLRRYFASIVAGEVE